MPKRSNNIGKVRNNVKKVKEPKKNEGDIASILLKKAKENKKKPEKKSSEYILNYRAEKKDKLKLLAVIRQEITGRKIGNQWWSRPDVTESLPDMKKRLQSIINEANNRMKDIFELELYSYAQMKAYDEAGTNKFDISKKKTKEEVIEEITRARDFLQDYTSTIEGAKLFDAEYRSEQYIQLFGKGWATKENGMKAYDTNSIDEETAKVAFRTYRKIEEKLYQSITSYGSDKMIAYVFSLIYDEELTEKQAENVASKFLQDKYGTQARLLHEQFEENNVEKDKADIELFKWRKSKF